MCNCIHKSIHPPVYIYIYIYIHIQTLVLILINVYTYIYLYIGLGLLKSGPLRKGCISLGVTHILNPKFLRRKLLREFRELYASPEPVRIVRVGWSPGGSKYQNYGV